MSSDDGAYAGESVALSANGNTALIGGIIDRNSRGAAWVFRRTGTGWHQQGPKLVPRGETGPGQFGEVSLSGNGNTALIGAWLDNDNDGAARLFNRVGATWRQQGNKLTGNNKIGHDARFSISTALSANGKVAIVGAPGSHNKDGAAWVFELPDP